MGILLVVAVLVVMAVVVVVQGLGLEGMEAAAVEVGEGAVEGTQVVAVDTSLTDSSVCGGLECNTPAYSVSWNITSGWMLEEPLTFAEVVLRRMIVCTQ
jgi:hypothetical protein